MKNNLIYYTSIFYFFPKVKIFAFDVDVDKLKNAPAKSPWIITLLETVLMRLRANI